MVAKECRVRMLNVMIHSTESHIFLSVQDNRMVVEGLWIFKLLTTERFILTTMNPVCGSSICFWFLA